MSGVAACYAVSRKVLAAGLLAAGLLAGWAATARADDDNKADRAEMERQKKLAQSIQWQDSGKGALGSVAEIAVPPGYRFTGREGTAAIMELTGNPPNPARLGVLVPAAADDDGWFIVFTYDDCGYVRDDDKDKLDAKALLESLRAGTEKGNEYRREHGWPTLRVAGWITPPNYDSQTHHLVWAVRVADEKSESANYNTRVLGRGGVLSANLVVDADKMESTIPTVKKLLTGVEFTAGNKYAEWKAGDKVAQYGLGALVAGGAAAVAVKTGFFAKLAGVFVKFIKVIVIAVVAMGAWVWQLITRRSRASEE